MRRAGGQPHHGAGGHPEADRPEHSGSAPGQGHLCDRLNPDPLLGHFLHPVLHGHAAEGSVRDPADFRAPGGLLRGPARHGRGAGPDSGIRPDSAGKAAQRRGLRGDQPAVSQQHRPVHPQRVHGAAGAHHQQRDRAPVFRNQHQAGGPSAHPQRPRHDFELHGVPGSPRRPSGHGTAYSALHAGLRFLRQYRTILSVESR